MTYTTQLIFFFKLKCEYAYQYCLEKVVKALYLFNSILIVTILIIPLGLYPKRKEKNNIM